MGYIYTHLYREIFIYIYITISEKKKPRVMRAGRKVWREENKGRNVLIS